MDPTIIAGIPAYNEANTIADVVAETEPFVDEVVVVDDGSGDETARRARRAGASVVEHERNQGYGAALATTFRYARDADADHLVILDGDGQHDPIDVPQLISKQQESAADIVIASRFVEGADSETPLYRRFGLGVVNTLTNAVVRVQGTRLGISDTQSGYRAYNREAIESLASCEEIGDGMDASLGILFHGVQQGYRFAEVPTEIDYDVDDANSQHPLTHGLTLVARILGEALPDWAVSHR